MRKERPTGRTRLERVEAATPAHLDLAAAVARGGAQARAVAGAGPEEAGVQAEVVGRVLFQHGHLELRRREQQ
jgi:hypothetical protein